MRHTCEQSDGMRGYGWEEFDARTGGVQKIYDEANGIDITTNFIKIANSNTGGSWATRIQGTMRNNSPPDTKTTIIFYASLDGDGHIEVDNDDDPLGFIGDVTLVGESSGLGKYQLTVRHGSGKHPKFEHEAYLTKPLDRTFVDSVIVPDRMIWQSKAILFQELKDQIDLYLGKYGKENPPAPAQMYSIPMKPGSGNVHLIQKVFEGNFEFDIILGNSSVGNDLSHAKVSDLIEKTSKDYWDEFRVIFELQPPFNVRGMQKFASILFSNLLGGLGYFYGDSVVDRSYSSEYDEENEDFWEETAAARARNHGKLEGPSELFTTVPSRSFFPRGFLWDEGFHLMPIIDWDFDLALEIYKSWYNLMDDDGWIGREQILGDEARSKVPAEFQVQYPHYANPPTLFLITDSLISKLIASNHTEPRIEKKSSISRGKSEYLKKPDLAFQYLRELYPKLRKNYFWYRKTQSGDLKSYDRTAFSSKEAYRWKGRSLQHILTSGLDDYPRPQPPHPGELHLDLISWMAMMTRSLGKFASLLGYEEDEEEFEEIGRAITRNIDDLHWSETEKCYCDATIDDYEENALVCHKGYVSIFPFLMGLLEPTSEKLGYMLDLIADPEEIWSEFGIRSLSKNSEFYGTDENYWRGPIWLNINYLVVSQLLVRLHFPLSYFYYEVINI